MSKYVKNLISEEMKQRLEGVDDALLVNVVGMDAQETSALRKRLREKEIQLVVIKNSVILRATEGTALAPAFEGTIGCNAVMWGCEDIVCLAKEVASIVKTKEFGPFSPTGGVMDGQKLSASEVTKISKWPSRTEQLSILVGQMLSPGAAISSQLLGPGGLLASQIEKKAESDGAESDDTESDDTENQ